MVDSPGALPSGSIAPVAKKSVAAAAPHAEPTTDAPIEEMSFERAYAELLEVVEKLEDADLTLEQSLELHARGRALSAYCTQKLDEATLRIRQLGSDK